MPSSTEQVFTALKEKKFDVINTLIEGEPALINAVNPENGNSIFQSLMGLLKPTDQSEALINLIVSAGTFDLGYVNPKSQLTNLDKIISCTRLDLFQQLSQNTQVVFNNGKLTYESAQKHLGLMQQALQKELAKDPGSDVSARFKIKVQHTIEITSLIRDATILFAISIDEPELLDKLKASGANPTRRLGALGKERLPIDLLTAKNPRIDVWFQRSLEQSVASTANNPHSFLNKAKKAEAIEAQLAKLKIDHLEERSKVKQDAISADLEVIERAVASL